MEIPPVMWSIAQNINVIITSIIMIVIVIINIFIVVAIVIISMIVILPQFCGQLPRTAAVESGVCKWALPYIQFVKKQINIFLSDPSPIIGNACHSLTH